MNAVTQTKPDVQIDALARKPAAAVWGRFQQWGLAIVLPIILLAGWHLATADKPYSLIPPPAVVGSAFWDLVIGGIRNDHFSGTLHTHILASVGRVYGGFALAVIAALPLGMVIGRNPFVRQICDPLLQIMRPIPVTAWLPLAMIIFGIGPKSAIFLVFLGAFYPVLLNTIFGVRSVEPRLFEAADMLGCTGSVQFVKVGTASCVARHFHRLATGAWLCLDDYCHRRNDRRADGTWCHNHGSKAIVPH